MSGTHFRLRHVVGAASLSCTLVLAAISVLPVAAQTATTSTVQSCPQLSVGNPNPGDNINAGSYVISGTAFDPASQSGAGITSVDLFLGERDQGGTFLGSAVPGSSGTDPRAWTATVTVPSNFDHNVDFAAYALSSVSGSETAVTFPIIVGTLPKTEGLVTPTPVPNLTETVTNNCKSMAPATTSSSSAAAPAVPSVGAVATMGMAPAASAPAASMASSNSCPTLSLANPNPGDDLTAGGMFISGTASESNAMSGSGVQRVDLFLGERDQGGTFLGSGIPGTGAGGNPDAFNVEVTIPNLGRGVDFAAYAIGANGQEQAVTFPVFVGSEPVMRSGAPTPTPIPATESITSTCSH
ncbi:MAG: hypothetical protein JO020_33575 [Chloroflexi bacterium]|nr:hypothetical protein [Chloroflexota bacterium]